MDINFVHEHPLEVIKYLYQFRDDNKFYHLDKGLLKDKSAEEKHHIIYTLRDHAFIATDTEIYHDHPVSNTAAKAKILPKGIVAVESTLK